MRTLLSMESLERAQTQLRRASGVLQVMGSAGCDLPFHLPVHSFQTVVTLKRTEVIFLKHASHVTHPQWQALVCRKWRTSTLDIPTF